MEFVPGHGLEEKSKHIFAQHHTYTADMARNILATPTTKKDQINEQRGEEKATMTWSTWSRILFSLAQTSQPG